MLMLAVLASFFALAAVSSAGRTYYFETDVRLGYNETAGNFRGRLVTRAQCRRSRVVRLYETQGPGPGENIGGTRSREGGRFSFGAMVPSPNSEYYAKTPRQSRGQVVCKPGTSERIQVVDSP